MLTREEQEQVVAMVRKMIRNDRARASRLRQGLVTPSGAQEWEARDWAELADLLKEVG